MLLSMELPDPEHKELLPKLWFFVISIAVTGLGAVARVLQDHKDSPRIQARIWFAYLASGALAGLVFVFILFNWFGPSYLLIGLSGLGGFKSVELLAWLAIVLKGIGGRKLKDS